MPTPFSLRPPPSTTSSSTSSSSAFSPTDPRHAISLPCPRTHLFSLSFSFIRRSLLCRDLLSTSTSARGRLFSPFRPRALCCCIISPTSVFAPYTPLAAARRSLSAPLSAMGQLFVYMAGTGVSAQYRAGRDRIARRYSRYAISRECAICNCYIGYESEKRSILKTDRTALGVERGNSRSNLSRGARLTLRVMKCNEKKFRRKPDVLRIIMLRLTTPQ